MREYNDGVEKCTKIFELYNAGKTFNETIEPDYYAMRELNIEYVQGNQWIGIENSNFPKAKFNFEKRFKDLYVAILCAAKTAYKIDPLITIDNDEAQEVTKMARHAINSYDQLTSFEYYKRDCVDTIAVQGEVATHILFDPKKKTTLGEVGEMVREKIYGINLMLGNANSNEISEEKQPYILVIGRDYVKDLQEEAKENGSKDWQDIKPDEAQEREDFTNYEEVNAKGYEKCTYIYKYEFIDGTVHVSKSTRTVDIYEKVDTELTLYPVSWLLWETMYESYHGKAMVEDLHDSQSYINKSFALLMYYTMSIAYGKPIYNSKMVKGWSMAPGVALGVDLPPGTDIRSVVANVAPSNMSGFIISAIELAIKYMKESIGISDALLGNVDPDNRGAIVVATKNTQAPLENQKMRIKQWKENEIKIMLDMMSVKYGTRKVLVEKEIEKDGQIIKGTVLEDFNFEKLKDTVYNVEVEIGDAGFFNELALTQTLDNLFNQQVLTVVQYLERLPDNVLPEKQKVIDELKGNMKKVVESKQQNQEQNQQQMSEAQMLAEAYQALPIEEQQRIANLPPEEQANAMRQLLTE